jgi:Tc5 transposase DNA-binding domain
MTDSYDEIEARIQAALASISPEEKPNIAKLSRDYAVPESRLHARYKGRKNRSNCGGAGRSLSDDQEQALCHIIECEEADGTYLHHWQLQDRANWILAQDHPLDSPDPPPTVGKCWPAQFLQCHPNLEIRTSHPLANERKWSHDVENLEK